MNTRIQCTWSLTSVGLLAGIGFATLLPKFGWTQESTTADTLAVAREAYGYGLPLVENYKTMFADAIDVGGDSYKAPFNSIAHETIDGTSVASLPVTANLDVLRSYLWMDLRAEPVLLEVPAVEADRYYAIQLVDLYTFNFDYIGSRTTGNGGGRYLIAGPNWDGQTPTGVDKVIRSETQFALAIYHTQLRGLEDIDRATQIQSQFTIQTLSDFVGLPAPEAAAALEFPRATTASTAETDLSFFATLNFLLQFCPPHPSEVDLMTRFARIGVGASPTFDTANLSPELQATLKRGMEEADASITAAIPTVTSAEIYGSREYLANDYLKRAVAAKIGLYAHSKEESLRSQYFKDGEGKPLDAGQSKYLLKFSATDLPPVNAFWSITTYDSQTKTLVANPLGRYLINSEMLSAFNRGPDGSVTLLIQSESPGEEQVANWLPAPNGPFFLVMRLYWPKPEAYGGTWSPPLVWREDTASTQDVPLPTLAEAADEVKPSVLAGETPPELDRPTVWGEPTEVEVAIYVIDVDEINSADQSFAASVYIEARWMNPLLKHKGPGPMNLGLTEVWDPRLTIIGQQMVWKSYPDAVEVQPNGECFLRQKMWGRFSQPLKLQDFPFDQQDLSIHLVAAGLMENLVKIVPLVNESGRSSDLAFTFSLPDFSVMSWTAKPTPYYPGPLQEGIEGVAGYEMKIHVGRQATYYVLKVIIPLCLIVVMSWLPRWMDPDQSGTNIGISTSAFLTLVAYLFAITVLLPKVSYVTRMDRFILLSTLTVFSGLIQTVANTALVSKNRKAVAERVDRWSRVVYPVLLMLVIVVSFIL